MTAFAAGHRPCALCRRADYVRLGEIWRELHPGQVGADAIDLQLHGERVAPGDARAAPPRGAARRPARRRLRPARGDAPGSCAARSCSAGRPRATRSASRGRATARDRDHAALPGRRAARGLAAARPALPSLDLTSDTFGIGKDRPLASGVRKQTRSAAPFGGPGGGTPATDGSSTNRSTGRYIVTHTLQRRLRRATGLGAVAMLALPLAAQAADYRAQLSESFNSGLACSPSVDHAARRHRQRRRRRAGPRPASCASTSTPAT